MIKKKDIDKISQLLNVNKIKKYELLSNSFDINCIKIQLENEEKYIVKYYTNQFQNFNAIKSEIRNLFFLQDCHLNFFPKIVVKNSKYLIINFIDNNNKQPNHTKNDLLKSILKIHSVTNSQFGFGFSTQIGGLEKKNNYNNNWVDFYRDKRLYYIFNLINMKNLLDKELIKKIEILLNKLDLMLPRNPKPSLLHGDLWEGNILFNNKKFIGFIDPGSFFGHNELEVAYLRWFNPKFIDENFLFKYNDYKKIDKNYLTYEPIYQLYYSLLNVYLWDESYIQDSRNLLNKIKI